MGAPWSGVPQGDVCSDSPLNSLGQGTIKKIHILCLFFASPKIPHFHCSRALPFDCMLAIPTAAELSQWIGVLGCGWPRSSRVIQKIIPS